MRTYQARDLPDADFIGGGIDPYFNVSYNGQVNKGRDEYISKNNLLVYRTIVMDDVTVPPDVNFLPQVNIQVWDWDFGGQDYIGCCFHTFTEDEILDGSDADPDAPDGGFPIVPPTWIDLLREEEGDCEGAVLASFQLIKVMVGKTLCRRPQSCRVRKCAIEVLAGHPRHGGVQLHAMQLPSLEFVLDLPRSSTSRTPRRASPSISARRRSAARVQDRHCLKRPTYDNANFLERLVGEIQMPIDPIFARRSKCSRRTRDWRFHDADGRQGHDPSQHQVPAGPRVVHRARSRELRHWSARTASLPVVWDDETDAAKKAIMQAAGVVVVSDEASWTRRR